MRRFIYLVLTFSFISCGSDGFNVHNPFIKRETKENRISYTSALTATEKDSILKDKRNVLFVCDVLNKSEFVFFEKFNSTYYGYVSDGVNVVDLSMSTKDNEIFLSPTFHVLYDDQGLAYLESNDYLEIENTYQKLEIVDESESLRVINQVIVNEDFTTTPVKRLYELVNCQVPELKEEN